MLRKSRTIICVLTLVIVSLISSCSKKDVTPAETDVNPTIDEQSAYPIDITGQQIESPDEMYPIIFGDLLSSFPKSLTIPEPDANSAVVSGKVLSISEGNAPFLNASLYLGAYLIPNEGGEQAPMLVGISPDIDPKAQQAQDGSFVFVDVPPGSYGLFLYTPMSAFLMTDAKTGEYVNVKVEAGQVIDLGTLYVK